MTIHYKEYTRKEAMCQMGARKPLGRFWRWGLVTTGVYQKVSLSGAEPPQMVQIKGGTK